MGVALDNARTFERDAALHAFVSTVHTAGDFRGSMRSITGTAASLLACAHVCVYVHAPRAAQLASRFTAGLPDFATHHECGVPGAVFFSGEAIQVDACAHAHHPGPQPWP